MQNMYSEAIPFGGTGGQFSGKNKGVLLTNNSGAVATVDLYNYKANGTTAANRISLLVGESKIFPIRTWGISCGSGITGSVLS